MNIIQTKSAPYYLANEKSEKYDDLKAQLNYLREIYNSSIDLITNKFEQRKKDFQDSITELRKSLKYKYSVTSTLTGAGLNYHIKRTTINPIVGDEEYCKDLEYTGIRFVNNVLIRTGEGYIIAYNGLILSDEEIMMLDNGEVPEILLNAKAEF